jgi:hypothetical protein
LDSPSWRWSHPSCLISRYQAVVSRFRRGLSAKFFFAISRAKPGHFFSVAVQKTCLTLLKEGWIGKNALDLTFFYIHSFYGHLGTQSRSFSKKANFLNFYWISIIEEGNDSSESPFHAANSAFDNSLV